MRRHHETWTHSDGKEPPDVHAVEFSKTAAPRLEGIPPKCCAPRALDAFRSRRCSLAHPPLAVGPRPASAASSPPRRERVAAFAPASRTSEKFFRSPPPGAPKTLSDART